MFLTLKTSRNDHIILSSKFKTMKLEKSQQIRKNVTF